VNGALRSPAVAMAVLLATATACGGRASGDNRQAKRPYSASQLEGFVLRPDEGPPGTQFVEGASGSLSVEQFWPSSCCPAQQEAFADAGFQAGYATLFERPGRSGDPIDTRPGYELLSSRAALFVTQRGAEEALQTWIEYHEAPELDAVPVDGLGEEAQGYVGSPDAPAETVVLYFWRMGRLLLYVRVSAGTGTVPVAEVRGLADRMDRRAS